MRQMWILEKLNFKTSRGEHAPRPLQCTRAFGARSYFSRINSVLLPPGLELYATYRLKNNYLEISITVLKFLK